MKSRVASRAVATLLACALLFVAPVAAGLFRVWVFQDVLQLGYALSVAESEAVQLQDVVQALEVELASLTSPAYLESMAQSYGLRPSGALQHMSQESSHGTP